MTSLQHSLFIDQDKKLADVLSYKIFKKNYLQIGHQIESQYDSNIC